jgi:hypothetical protein
MHHRGQIGEESVDIGGVIGVEYFRETRVLGGIQCGELAYQRIFQIVFAAKEMERVQERRRLYKYLCVLNLDTFGYGLQAGDNIFVI